jgi:hypothetical protein
MPRLKLPNPFSADFGPKPSGTPATCRVTLAITLAGARVQVAWRSPARPQPPGAPFPRIPSGTRRECGVTRASASRSFRREWPSALARQPWEAAGYSVKDSLMQESEDDLRCCLEASHDASWNEVGAEGRQALAPPQHSLLRPWSSARFWLCAIAICTLLAVSLSLRFALG